MLNRKGVLVINIQVPDGHDWRTVATRDGSEMDHPEPVHAKHINATPGSVVRLVLTRGGVATRKRMLITEA